ncbi:MAG: XRE family transcriptional regulator [Deinococcales bacterium]
MSEERIDFEIGSGNVFADLGLPNPEERLLKVCLASMIYDIIQTHQWTQHEAAKVLGVSRN